MLVEINLLPQKAKRSIKAVIITSAIVLVTLSLYIVGYFWYDSKLATIANLEAETQIVVKLRELAEQKKEEAAPVDSIEQLQEKINWIEGQQISIVSLLNHFVGLLPPRGYFMSYQYSDQGTVSVTVQFDSAREAATYLHSLNESPFVRQVMLQQLNISELNDEDTEERFEYLPRYIASYQIEIDRESAKGSDKKGDE